MSDITPRNIRNAIKSFIPNWLSDRPGLNIGFSVIFVVALMADMFIEQLFQGTDAPLPGIGTPTALPYIGRMRGMIRGLGEADAAYIARLIGWLDLWAVAGGAETLVQLIQTVLGGGLVIRLIDRAGNFVTANADGTTTKVTDATWDWDSEIAAHAPSRAAFWGDTWLVIYNTDGRWPTYTNTSDPAWIAAWGTYQGFGAGLQVPRNAVDIVYQVVASFKGAHTWLAAIITCEDPTLFVPGSLGGIPSGDFGNFGHYDMSNVYVRARLQTHFGSKVRYWIPTFGG
jgi:hypothetical protein